MHKKTALHSHQFCQRPAIADVSIRIRDMSRTYRIPGRKNISIKALKPTSFDLKRGQFTAIVGASGSGKSTLMLCMAGLDRPTDGCVELLGTRTDSLKANAKARFRAEHVGFIFQDDNLITSLTARENVALPGQLRKKPLDSDRIDEALRRVGLTQQSRQKPAQLSGCERQRVAVARVLSSQPDIIFADEPTASLDIAAGQQVLTWLREAASHGSTVLMVTHDAEAASVTDRVLVMNGGSIVRELPGGNPELVSKAVLQGRLSSGHAANRTALRVGPVTEPMAEPMMESTAENRAESMANYNPYPHPRHHMNSYASSDECAPTLSADNGIYDPYNSNDDNTDTKQWPSVHAACKTADARQPATARR
jgi:putative ABC transport system ATP-binding protein